MTHKERAEGYVKRECGLMELVEGVKFITQTLMGWMKLCFFSQNST